MSKLNRSAEQVNLAVKVNNVNPALTSHIDYIMFNFLKKAWFNEWRMDANSHAYVAHANNSPEIFCPVMTICFDLQNGYSC